MKLIISELINKIDSDMIDIFPLLNIPISIQFKISETLGLMLERKKVRSGNFGREWNSRVTIEFMELISKIAI